MPCSKPLCNRRKTLIIRDVTKMPEPSKYHRAADKVVVQKNAKGASIHDVHRVYTSSPSLSTKLVVFVHKFAANLKPSPHPRGRHMFKPNPWTLHVELQVQQGN